MIYFSCFTISSVLMLGAQKFLEKNIKSIGYIFSFLGILVLTILAARRSSYVGTDTLMYSNFFTEAIHSSFKNYFHLLSDFGVEPGFILFNFLISKFTSSVIFYQGICSFFIETIIWCGLIEFKKKSTLALEWIVFCLLFYGNTLNIMRQSIALAITFFAYALWSNKRNKYSILLVLIAMTFHKSAVIVFIVLIIGRYLFTRKTSTQLNRSALLILMLTPVLGLIIERINATGILGMKYLNYMNVASSQNINAFLMRLPLCILIIIDLYRNRKNENYIDMWLYLLTLQDLILLPIQNDSVVIGRLLLFFGISKIITYPQAINDITNNRILRCVLNILLIILLVIIFYLQVINNNNGGIYPYVSY